MVLQAGKELKTEVCKLPNAQVEYTQEEKRGEKWRV
jgi:hypothetical protein